MKLKHFIGLVVVVMMFLSAGCGGSSKSNNFAQMSNGNGDNTIVDDDKSGEQTDDKSGDTGDDSGDTGTTDAKDLEAEILANNPTVTKVSSGTYALEVTKSQTVSNVYLMKGGSSSASGTITAAADDDDYNFRGTNAAVRVSDKAVLTLTKSIISTDAEYANAVFSYGGNLSGTTSADGDQTAVNISDCVIYTSQRGSGGIMTTGGGITYAKNLYIVTQGGSSAPIRTDKGGGYVEVDGGYYEANGAGSPAIYCTADIKVSDAELVSNLAQGVVIEGKNSVYLDDCYMTVNNTNTNGNNSTRYQSVMIYQSNSGDASTGKGAFTMSGGEIINKNGDIFFITNTTADITLEDVDIENQDSSGVLLRAELAGWSTTNGGNVNLYANDQKLEGDIIVDSSSAMNLYLNDGSTYSGAINSANAGDVYVEIEDGSTWTLTGNSYIKGLTCEADAVELGNYTLTVDGTVYTSGASTGSAIEFSSDSSSSGSDSSGGNNPPDDGPSGDGNSDNNPPERPGGEQPNFS